MLCQRITMRALPALALGWLLGGTAQADEQTFVVSVPQDFLAWTQPALVPKFDKALGTLTGLRIAVDANLLATLAVESTDPLPTSVTVNLDATVEVQRPDGSMLVLSALHVEGSDNVSSSDGVFDFAGPSGRTFPDLTDNQMTVSDQIPISAQDKILFTGPEGNPGTIALLTVANGNCAASNSANATASCRSQADASVIVTYFFSSDCNDNNMPDDEDILTGPSLDCNNNSIPDECEPDCDGDLVPDDCEDDCDGDSLPDDCEDDCDGDGIPDDCGDSCEPVLLDCEEFDRFERLTPNETLTVMTNNHNPQQEAGYAFAYAVNNSGQGVGFDHLVGHLLVLSGIEVFEYSINPLDYRAVVAEDALTDVDTDSIRDLDDSEYESVAGELLVPRFIGQGGRMFSQLILVGLSGGSRFTTTVDFAIYNDDEDAFSAQHTFQCWDKLLITDVSNVFRNDFLDQFSGDNPNKYLGESEYGWFKMDGNNAASTFFNIIDPAFAAVYIEVVGDMAAADLPFEICEQPGHLLPRSITGDNTEFPPSSFSAQDCAGNTDGRKPASLLLYPLFDNRRGVATVYSITNVNTEKDARVHFVYVGRFGL